MSAPVPPSGSRDAVMPLLSVMMFLQFFIWGSWYVTAPRVLDPIGVNLGWTYSVGPIAGMISPLFVGIVADRFFATQRVLGVMHLLGAGVMFFATTLMTGEEPGSSTTINSLLFGYMLCYMPTLALTNTVALHQFSDAEKQFPLVRVFGTIGWIAAGIALTLLGWDKSVQMFHLATGTSALLGVFSFFLPNTPPPAAGKPFSSAQALGLDALVLLKQPAFAVFMLCSFLVCIPLAFYYQMAERTLGAGGLADTAFKMTFGQMSEILFMLVMPWFFARLGVKWMLAVGMAAWVIRYGLFHLGMPDGVAWMLLVGVALHGICYDFFFVTGQIFTDKVAPKAIRGQAQGLLVLFTLGLGMFIGAQVADAVEARYTDAPRKEALSAEVKPIRASIDARIADGVAPDAKELEPLQQQARALELQVLRTTDWSSVYVIPAIGAAAILLLFLVTFRPRREDE